MSSKKTSAAAEAMERITEQEMPKGKQNTPSENVMYVGPTVPGIGIQNRVYTEIPEGAMEAIGREPEIGNLFIPIRSYPDANRMLREKKGYIYSAYVKALGFKGGKRS